MAERQRCFDSKLDRTTNTFVILGLWLEDEALGKDEAFALALRRGFERFITFLEASKLEAQATGYTEAMRLGWISKKLVERNMGG
jgi:hypothetical protein